MMDPELIKLLGCPMHPSRPPLAQDGDFLVCQNCACGLNGKFPIKNGIPHLLPENVISGAPTPTEPPTHE